MSQNMTKTRKRVVYIDVYVYSMGKHPGNLLP